jgi:hypothetical protein
VANARLPSVPDMLGIFFCGKKRIIKCVSNVLLQGLCISLPGCTLLDLTMKTGSSRLHVINALCSASAGAVLGIGFGVCGALIPH